MEQSHLVYRVRSETPNLWIVIAHTSVESSFFPLHAVTNLLRTKASWPRCSWLIEFNKRTFSVKFQLCLYTILLQYTLVYCYSLHDKQVIDGRRARRRVGYDVREVHPRPWRRGQRGGVERWPRGEPGGGAAQSHQQCCLVSVGVLKQMLAVASPQSLGYLALSSIQSQ